MYQWVKRYVDPSSSAGGRLINEMRDTLFGSAKLRVINGIVAKVAERPLQIQLIQFFIAHEKVTNGLHLLIVCSKDIPYENRLTSLG